MPRTTSMGVPSLRAELLLPKGSKMEWKFIKPQNPYHPGSGWTWEPEPFRNRCLQVTTKDSMEVTCTWGELDMEIKELNYMYEPEVHTSGDTKEENNVAIVKTLSIEKLADIKDTKSVSDAEGIKEKVSIKNTTTVTEDVKEIASKDRHTSRWRRF